MLLAIDIGNSNIECGIFPVLPGNLSLSASFRIATNKSFTTDELGVLILNMLSCNNIKKDDIKNAIFASVVPPLNHNISKTAWKYFGREIIQCTRHLLPDIKIDYDNPDSVGIDRLLGARGAAVLYGLPAVIVDFGTATTIDLIDKTNTYRGGLIMPGVAVSLEALSAKTSMLPKIDLVSPRSLIGKSTRESMQNGIYYLNSCGIDGILAEIISREFSGQSVQVIATGGLSKFFVRNSKIISIADDFLSLKSLKLVFDGLSEKMPST
ncbi:MAG: hypothetical protein A2096_03940 [Spirochaetes bacterium GWF1_41_5]|nr:MAG: hypothetical protein A2096_03940 [Spirochaetes bacterium GWF1_41_5]HBE03842.1 pantothenate kinase [Spirochaetia bacterium]